jgi:ATP-dependent helicase/nuclease subunit B
VGQIELALRKRNSAGGWDAITQALRHCPAAADWLSKIGACAAAFWRTRYRSLREWSETTLEAMEVLGMRAALGADAAGRQVLGMIEALAGESASVAQTFSFSEWRAVCNLRMEAIDFSADSTDRRVVMLHLNGARLRSFDAVLLIGADAKHLPSPHADVLFFAEAVRRELGMSTRESRQRQQLRDFASLLCCNPETVLTWRTSRNGERTSLSPWLQRLELALMRAGQSALPRFAPSLPLRSVTQMLPTAPAPTAPALLPRKLSASAFNTLVACPYQFFATRMLGLTEVEEFSDLPEKRDYGNWLHQILATYHVQVRDRRIEAHAERENLLREISANIFADAMRRNGAALAYSARWHKAIPAYLEWADARELEGWHFVAGEQWFEKSLTWPGGEILLQGRIDRIDQHRDGQHALLDYKTTDRAALSKRLKSFEDHQLAFYGLLMEQAPASAHYVALDMQKKGTGDVQPPHYAAWREGLKAQIVVSMRAIGAGAALPASAPESVCRRCEVRGLCRKGAW